MWSAFSQFSLPFLYVPDGFTVKVFVSFLTRFSHSWVLRFQSVFSLHSFVMYMSWDYLLQTVAYFSASLMCICTSKQLILRKLILSVLLWIMHLILHWKWYHQVQSHVDIQLFFRKLKCSFDYLCDSFWDNYYSG